MRVIEKSVAMGVIISKLLEKVEELTLHVIKQEKEIKLLKKRVKKNHK